MYKHMKEVHEWWKGSIYVIIYDNSNIVGITRTTDREDLFQKNVKKDSGFNSNWTNCNEEERDKEQDL